MSAVFQEFFKHLFLGTWREFISFDHPQLNFPTCFAWGLKLNLQPAREFSEISVSHLAPTRKCKAWLAGRKEQVRVARGVELLKCCSNKISQAALASSARRAHSWQVYNSTELKKYQLAI
jgi:hypothetical protein